MDTSVAIDSLEFARAGSVLSGEVDVAELPRLADSLFDRKGRLKYTIQGRRDARQRPCLALAVEGEINLRCQRCLGSLPYAVAVDASLLVLTPESTPPVDAIDDLDGVPADAHTKVWTLVEDEVLLAVPYAPRHPEDQCAVAIATKNQEAVSPFAVLSKIRSS